MTLGQANFSAVSIEPIDSWAFLSKANKKSEPVSYYEDGVRIFMVWWTIQDSNLYFIEKSVYSEHFNLNTSDIVQNVLILKLCVTCTLLRKGCFNG